jgi:hypothetical protein
MLNDCGAGRNPTRVVVPIQEEEEEVKLIPSIDIGTSKLRL